MRCWLIPGAKAKNPDPRTTDDKFLVVLDLNETQSQKAQEILREAGAEEVTIKNTYAVKPKYELKDPQLSVE